jgi:hypothetical protein
MSASWAAERERGLRLVEDVHAVRLEARVCQREKRLAVRLLVQRSATVGSADLELVDRGRDVEEALGPEEEAVAGRADLANKPEMFVQPGDGFPGREVEVVGAALGVEAESDRDGFDQGRLATAVAREYGNAERSPTWLHSIVIARNGHRRLRFELTLTPVRRVGERGT